MTILNWCSLNYSLMRNLLICGKAIDPRFTSSWPCWFIWKSWTLFLDCFSLQAGKPLRWHTENSHYSEWKVCVCKEPWAAGVQAQRKTVSSCLGKEFIHHSVHSFLTGIIISVVFSFYYVLGFRSTVSNLWLSDVWSSSFSSRTWKGGKSDENSMIGIHLSTTKC